MFQERTFQAQKIKKLTLKKFLIFWEMKLCSPEKLNKLFLNIIAPKKLSENLYALNKTLLYS